MAKFMAHISDDKLREQSVQEHLKNTALLAGQFADKFCCRDWGFGCGMLHDIGKYSKKFQLRLHGGPIVDHATAGARELYSRGYLMAAYCVAGHHSGLPDGGTQADIAGSSTLYGRMKKQLKDYQAYQSEIVMPEFTNPPLVPVGRGGFSVSFFIRMLYSCLVDADFLDTEQFMSDGTARRIQNASMEELLQSLRAYITPWMEQTEQATVNGKRTAILQACLDKGKEKQGLYTLTVPTGGGKTVSSLAFALQHAVEHHLDRVIYVIPYTSIIEQNAQVFRDILGSENVLEDHCHVSYESEEELLHQQLAAENWDKSLVVTTNVQFFESLFSNRSSKCRKLHNIANSVVIFDEAQMLPVNYLSPCVRAISELICNYHSTAVLCTATQPSLNKIFPGEVQVKESCNNTRENCKTKFFAFTKSDEFRVPSVLKQPIAVTEQICRKYKDISSLEAIHEYFERLYCFKGEGLDAKEIVSQFEDGVKTSSYPFETAANEFRIIENKTKTILICQEEEGARLTEKMRLGLRTRKLLRDVGNYCVSVYEKDFEALNAAGKLEVLDEEFAVLRNCELYSEDVGLIIDASRGDAVFY